MGMDLTERTVESKTVFQGKIVTVLVDQAELPNGKRAVREVVLHPGGVAHSAPGSGWECDLGSAVPLPLP